MLITEERIKVLFELFHTKLKETKKTRTIYHRTRNKAGILAADHLIRSLKAALVDLKNDPQGTYKAFESAVTSPAADAARIEREKEKRNEQDLTSQSTKT